MVTEVKIPPDPPPTTEEAIGRTLFGRPSRMIVCLWIASMSDKRAAMFNGSQIWDWCQQTDRKIIQNASADLHRLAEIGMIERTHIEDSRAKWYRRCDHPMWDVIVLLDVVLAEIPGPLGQRRYYHPTPEQVEATIVSLCALRAELAG